MNDFIAIDFETATENPESAVSVGLVKYRNYQLISTYYSLICSQNLYIHPDFTEIHGLTVDDVKDAPDFSCIWKNEIRGFIGKILLAAHNASFDMNVLKAFLNGMKYPYRDYRIFARFIYPVMSGQNLNLTRLRNLPKNSELITTLTMPLTTHIPAGNLCK